MSSFHVRPVVHHGAVVGAITLRKLAGQSLTPAENRLLTDLVAHTRVTLGLEVGSFWFRVSLVPATDRLRGSLA